MNALNPSAFADSTALASGEIALEAANSNDQPAPVIGAGHAVLERNALQIGLDIVNRVVERRNYTPILGNILIRDAGGDAVDMIATDLDIEIAVRLPAAVDPGFAVTFQADTAQKIGKKAPKSDMVALVSRGEIAGEPIGDVKLDFERAHYSLPTLPTADFPRLENEPAAPYAEPFTMTGEAFRDMLGAVEGAISTEETRYYLNGIFLEFDREFFTAVATDGHRLYRQEIERPADMRGDIAPVILPRKTNALFQKLMKGKSCPDTVQVEVGEKRIRVTFGPVTITSKLVDGTFPDYRRVIPTANPKHVRFDRDAFAEALQAVMVIASQRGRAFKLDAEGGHMLLSINDPETGSAHMRLPCTVANVEDAEGDAYAVAGFNSLYMEGAMAEIGAGEVLAELNTPGDPIVMRGSRAGWTAVLMPMRI